MFYRRNSSFETQFIAYKEIFYCSLDNALYQHYISPRWLANHRLGWQAEFSRWGCRTGSWPRKYAVSTGDRLGCRAVLVRSAFAWAPCSNFGMHQHCLGSFIWALHGDWEFGHTQSPHAPKIHFFLLFFCPKSGLLLQ